MAQEDVHHLSDAGLALGLSLGGGGAAAAASDSAPTAHHHRRSTTTTVRPCAPLEPSLTLSMPDEATATGSAHSVSSLSVGGVKRERAEDAETTTTAERASYASTPRPSGNEQDDADDGSTRKKLRLTKEQSALLEDRFKEHSTLNPKQKVALAKQLNLRPRQVEVWFQNRRARTKLKQTEVDCELLKRCCETLTEENRRLQRELQELRALNLKFAPPPPPPSPVYMQLPAATLTICPSCDRLTGGGPAGGANKPEPADSSRPSSKAAAAVVRTTTAAHHLFNPFTHSAAC